MADLFRKSSLEKLSSPEQLDRLTAVTRRRGYIAVLGVLLMLIVGLAWGFFGTLPQTEKVSGIVVNEGGVQMVYSDTTGIVDELPVRIGSEISEGDVVASVADDSPSVEADVLRSRLKAVQAVTLDTTDDVPSQDNQEMIDLKTDLNSIRVTVAADERTLADRQADADSQQAKVDRWEAEMNAAKAAYYNSLKGDESGVYSTEYSEAKTKYDKARSDYMAADSLYWNKARFYQSLMYNLHCWMGGFESVAYGDNSVSLDIIFMWTRTISPYNDWFTNAATNKTGFMHKDHYTLEEFEAALNSLTSAIDNKEANITAACAALKPETDAGSENMSVPRGNMVCNAFDRKLHVIFVLFGGSAIGDENLKYLYNVDYQADAEWTYIMNTWNELEIAEADLDIKTQAYETAQTEFDNAYAAYTDYLYKHGATSGDSTRMQTEYQSAQSQYNTEYADLLSMQQAVETARQQLAADKIAEETQRAMIADKFDTARTAATDDLTRQLAKVQDTEQTKLDKRQVNALSSGVVTDVLVQLGSSVQPGTELMQITRDAGERKIVSFYVPVAVGKKIDYGMDVKVYASQYSSQEYGHMEATVVHVDEYVTGTQSIKNILGDDSLVQNFTANGPVVAVTCYLREDAATASGYWWSSEKGREVKIAKGDIVSGEIVVTERRPIDLFWPWLKEKLTVTQQQGKTKAGAQSADTSGGDAS